MSGAARHERRSTADVPRDDLGLSPAALAVLAARYLRRDGAGRVVEPPGEMMDLFLDAWRAGRKGITVYRDTSRPGQVLQRAPTAGPGAERVGVHIDQEYSGGCTADPCRC